MTQLVFSNTQAIGGGADGSILTFDDVEPGYLPNKGMKTTVKLLKQVMERPGLSPEDL